MTTLADLAVGDAFVLQARVTGLDQVTGMSLAYFGPDGAGQGTMVISPMGAFSGQLAGPPNAIPVQTVQIFSAVSSGDVLQHNAGETMVARRVRIEADGSYQWSASGNGPVWYSMADWSVIAHVDV
jgi:hypothetical protein